MGLNKKIKVICLNIFASAIRGRKSAIVAFVEVLV